MQEAFIDYLMKCMLKNSHFFFFKINSFTPTTTTQWLRERATKTIF